jgi:molecular chaperone DnaJ
MSDIFDDLFSEFMGGRRGGRQRSSRERGSDLRYNLEITFEEAAFGAETQLKIPRAEACSTCSGTGAKEGTSAQTCPQCSGRGEIRHARQTMLGQMVNVVTCPRCRGEGKIVEAPCDDCGGDGRKQRTKRLRIAVPAGIDDGHQIRLSAEGEAGPRGGPPGSLYVAIHVAAHPHLRREGTELYHELELSIAQAALGTTVRVPTADGEEDLDIKPGTQPGTEVRLRGRGAPHLRRTGSRGDLHVLVNVKVPTKLNREQRTALEAYAAASGETSVGGKGGGVLARIKDALG